MGFLIVTCLLFFLYISILFIKSKTVVSFLACKLYLSLWNNLSFLFYFRIENNINVVSLNTKRQ